MKINVYLLLMISASYSAFSQGLDIYPTSFLKFQDNYIFYNPAAVTKDVPLDLRAVNNNYTGLLKNVGFIYLEGSIRKQRQVNQNSYGVSLYTEYETKLLRKTRGLFRYSWTTLLAQKMKFSGGVSLGFYNLFVQGTTSSLGVSSFSMDGNIGVWLHNENFNMGVSINQFANSSLRSVNSTYVLKRYFVFLTDYKWIILAKTKLLVALKVSTHNSNRAELHSNINFLQNDMYEIGFVYRYLNGAGLGVGLRNLKLDNAKLDISFSYLNHFFLTPLKTGNLDNDRIEVSLIFFK